MKKKVLIIGAGIHGSTVAIELAKSGFDVFILDSNSDILMATSGATHNRAHLGFHYPRSAETAIECKVGHEYFNRHFNGCISYPDFYYLIEKDSLKVSPEDYRNFIKKVGLRSKEEWPQMHFLNKEHIATSFKVEEGYFDLSKIKKIIKDKFSLYKIKTKFDFLLEKAEYEKGNMFVLYSSNKTMIEIEADIVINATYTNTNAIQKAFGLSEDATEYEFENTEVVVVSSNCELPALTVMDGPYITILPYGGHPGMYLVYDVLHSVVKRNYGINYIPFVSEKSNWSNMQAHGLKYFPFFKDLKYEYSLWANRPIPTRKEIQINDSRATRILKHVYPVDFYSILEGKFISAPMIAEDLVNRIKIENE